MILNRDIIWTATSKENPHNTRPVTAVVSDLDGAHTVGAHYKEGKWYEQYTKTEITDEVVCWADLEIPHKYMF